MLSLPKVLKFLFGIIRAKIIAVYLGTGGAGIIVQLQNILQNISGFTTPGMPDGMVRQLVSANAKKFQLGSCLLTTARLFGIWSFIQIGGHSMPVMNSGPLVFHSDRGAQYACNEFRTLLEGYVLVKRSMSRKGNCWDNAVAESFFKNLKMEWVYQKKYRTRMQAALSVFEYIESWYNPDRIHSALEMSIKDFNAINNEQKLYLNLLSENG